MAGCDDKGKAPTQGGKGGQEGKGHGHDHVHGPDCAGGNCSRKIIEFVSFM